jgi:pyruvate-formate lyase-activating enzyme
LIDLGIPCWQSESPRLFDYLGKLPFSRLPVLENPGNNSGEGPITPFRKYGVSNTATIENFKWVSTFIPRRPEPPLVVASTLLVPGYVDEAEVTAIAAFLAELNPEIPYRLLAFHPEFRLRDLPPTSRSHAECCRAAAERAGLQRISFGNLHLLGNDYTC